MAMFNPPHPGESLRELYIEPLNLNVIDIAQKLKIEVCELNNILDGKCKISPQIAIKLAKGFGGSAESWLQQQSMHDLWCTQQIYSADDVEIIHRG